jgi:nucleotide-binding universal stress UspA family protein
VKTILLPFADDAACRIGLDTAFLVARRFGSYLEGLLVRDDKIFEPTVPPIGEPALPPVPADYLSEVTRRWRQFADKARERFMQLTSEKGMPHGELETEGQGPLAGWREMQGPEKQVVGEYGRLFDLIVVCRRPAEAASWQETCEAALFESGRPVLLAPNEPPVSLGDTIVIAWNGSTETARTLAMGMGLLTAASRVVVLTVEGGMLPGPSGRELAAHLLRNGVPAEAVTVDPRDRSVGETFVAEAAEMHADLLVKGAYTRSRLRQIIFGGATEYVIKNATMPVLMAH